MFAITQNQLVLPEMYVSAHASALINQVSGSSKSVMLTSCVYVGAYACVCMHWDRMNIKFNVKIQIFSNFLLWCSNV